MKPKGLGRSMWRWQPGAVVEASTRANGDSAEARALVSERGEAKWPVAAVRVASLSPVRRFHQTPPGGILGPT